MAARPRVGPQARRVRADRAGRRLRRGRDCARRRGSKTASGSIDGSKIFITNAGTDITACVTITARHRRERDLEPDRPERHAGLRDLARRCRSSAGARRTRASSRSRARACRRATCSAPRGAGLKQFLRDPRRRPDLGRRDGRRPRAGLLRPRVGVREGAQAVRQADRERSRRCSRSSSTWRPRSRRRALLVYRAAWEKDQGRDFARTAAMAKLYSGELSHRAANWALQIHGGYGFMDEYADLAPLPRPEDPRDRRGHERGAAHGDRPAPRACRRACTLDSCCSASSSTTTSAAARTWSATTRRGGRRRSRVRDRAVPRGRGRRPASDRARARDAHARRPPLGPRALRARARRARLDPPAGASPSTRSTRSRTGRSAGRLGRDPRRPHAGPPPRALLVRRRRRALVLTGDSLFVGDAARPDLAIDAREGAADLCHSLRRLAELPDATSSSIPGHVSGSLCGTNMSAEHSTLDRPREGRRTTRCATTSSRRSSTSRRRCRRRGRRRPSASWR